MEQSVVVPSAINYFAKSFVTYSNVRIKLQTVGRLFNVAQGLFENEQKRSSWNLSDKYKRWFTYEERIVREINLWDGHTSISVSRHMEE